MGRGPGSPPRSVIQSCCSTQNLIGSLPYQCTGYNEGTDRPPPIPASSMTSSTSSTRKKLCGHRIITFPLNLCVCVDLDPLSQTQCAKQTANNRLKLEVIYFISWDYKFNLQTRGQNFSLTRGP